MKISSILLGGSLAANAVLLALFISGAFAGSDSTPAAPNANATASHAVAAAAASAADIDPATWTNLQPDDLPGILARLRAEGFPLEMVRAIMGELVRVQFAPRRAALGLNDKLHERPFWEPATLDAKTEAARRQILKEQNQALKDLLGPDATDDTALANLRRQLPNFSDDKITAIQRAQQTLSEKGQAIIANLPNAIFSAADLAGINQEFHTELAKILTPQELGDYDLRTSNTANNLRRQLAAFDPSEQEFRTPYQLQKAFDDQYQLSSSIATMAPDQQRQLMTERNQAQQQLNAGIQAALGDQRYADYQRSSNYDFQQTSKLVSRLDLPPDTASQLYAIQQEFTQRSHDVGLGAGPRPSVAELQTQLAALGEEAKARITALIGPTGYQAYQQYGGQWMQNVRLRTAPPPAIVRPAGG